MNGSGRCVHDDPTDRREETLSGEVTVYAGGPLESYLLVPVID